MPGRGSRQTDSDMLGDGGDMGHRLNPTAVREELRRLARAKADTTWVEGKFEAAEIKHRFLAKEHDELQGKVQTMADVGVMTANKASEARRLAREAKEAVSIGHICHHENTFTNLESNVAETVEIVKNMTKVRRWISWGQVIGLVLFVGTVAGTIIAWRVDTELGKKERIELKENDVKQEAALNRIEGKLDRKSIDDVDGMTAAFKKALEEHDKEKSESSNTSNQRGRRTQ